EAVPHINGVNNHMGSRFTEDDRRMRVMLEVVKERGLYFLDSKTTSHSSAYRLARGMGIRAADRQVFLDNEQDVEYIKKQVERLIEVAKDKGSAIAIGHPHPATLSALKEMVPMLKEAGVEITPLSSLVN
ncbi:MAG: divergent polysaccharide deacetylase family protein, partial [Deltaproteobacteria bacterium]|nr:divergent polysaccharide deacetylase family protein [Deltaproteobacteria bacterium]